MPTRVPEGVVDFHTHILPIDHGSKNTEMSRRQWDILAGAGLSAVVATPHFYPHAEPSVEDFLARRQAAAEALLSESAEGAPRLYLGAEVLVVPRLEEMEGLERLCIEGTRLLLLEMPLSGWSRRELATAHAVAERGLTPLIAHIDRYPRRALADLYESRDFLYQVNLGALAGLSPSAFYFRRMLRAGAIAALGSDMHGIPADGYERYARLLCRYAPHLATVNAHTSEMLASATPYR